MFATMLMFYLSTRNDVHEVATRGREPDIPRLFTVGSSIIEMPGATVGLLVDPARALRNGAVEVGGIISNNLTSAAPRGCDPYVDEVAECLRMAGSFALSLHTGIEKTTAVPLLAMRAHSKVACAMPTRGHF